MDLETPTRSNPLPAPAPSDPVLRVEGLKTHFVVGGRRLRAVDGISFDLHRGETLGLVGESGCGKSVTALSILRLIKKPPGEIVGGAVYFGGRDLLKLPMPELRQIRGNEISMIFQEPMTSLNPVMTIGRQISESITRHQNISRRAALDLSAEMLDMVKLPDATGRLKQYPHQLSGGMRQRVMIAMALACDPKILIADEPTTALDVTIQAQILDLRRELQAKLGTSILLITHDLGVIAEAADRVVVMYAGRKVEEADVADLFETPRHPYPRGLLASVPRPQAGNSERKKRLAEIPGMVPQLDTAPQGCTFAPRCGLAEDRCREQMPPLEEKASNHWAACWEAVPTPGNGRG